MDRFNTEEFRKKVFDNSPMPIVVMDAETYRYLDCNPAAVKIYRYPSREAALGKTPLDVSAPVQYDGTPSAEKEVFYINKALQEGSVVFEWKHQRPNGEIWDGEIHLLSFSINNKRLLQFSITDITERKQAENALRESEERFSRLTQASFEGIAIHDKGLILDANQALADIFGCGLSELIGTNVLDLAMPESRDLVRNNFLSGYEKPYEATGRKKDGTVLVGELMSRPLTYQGRTVRVTAVRDITARKQAEEALRKSEENFRVLFHENPLPMLLSEIPSGKIAFVNKRLADLFGLDVKDIVGKTANEIGLLKDPGDQDKLTVLIVKNGYVDNVEVERVSPSGVAGTSLISMRIITVNGKQFCLAVLQDITDRKRVEKALQNTQKLESLGILAGGIAHDFNNLLAGIFGYIDLARSVSKDPKTTGYLDSTLATMNRAKALTLQLLTFAKGGAPVQKITPLVPFIQETAQFALSGSNISCQFTLTENLWPCHIDKNQIGQVIDNIVINAQQAMPNGGAIEISAKNISLKEKEHPPLAKGNYVKVSIKDRGIGIPKDILPRIFDPFYTTKTKGHGLGLSTCYSIINRHAGCIDVESEPGKGSTFHVYLPASAEAAVAEAAAVLKHKGTGTIIVMDDEEVLRDTFRKMLESLGYSVACKKDGREAVDFFINESKAGHKFAAMLFDLTIPGGMGGIEAVNEIRKLNKEIPVFVVSGYADNSVMKNPGEHGFTASISKPFTLAELAELLNKYV